ncbi:MAG TPA: hypothetical protein VF950_22640 [Planctomycetota bacterium]
MSSIRVGVSVGRKTVSRAIVDVSGSPTFDILTPGTPIPESGAPISVAISSAFPETVAPMKLIGSLPLRCLTSSTAALANVFGECAFTAAGEHYEVWRDASGAPRGRSYPADGPDDEGALDWNGRPIPIQYAAAFAVAVCDPDQVPNSASKMVGATRALLERLREPILNVAAAATLVLSALGVWFHRETAREEADLEITRRATLDLWTRLLPADPPKESGLPRALQARLGEGGEESGPSALAFWGEIGKHLPDPEPLGLSVESLDLSPEGGRLSARVPAGKEDPLKNAAALEGHLNQSDKLRARGDYEVRDGQVQVRLRMEFKP